MICFIFKETWIWRRNRTDSRTGFRSYLCGKPSIMLQGNIKAAFQTKYSDWYHRNQYILFFSSNATVVFSGLFIYMHLYNNLALRTPVQFVESSFLQRSLPTMQVHVWKGIASMTKKEKKTTIVPVLLDQSIKMISLIF